MNKSNINLFLISRKFKSIIIFFSIGTLIFVQQGCKKSEIIIAESVYDIDGNFYHSVVIGSQVWTVENLRVTHYRNGDIIPKITNASEWSHTDSGGLCSYGNRDSNIVDYGLLYNGFAIEDNRNICPEGWHVPSDSEWQEMIDYLGGNNIAGGKMKEEGTEHWCMPNTGATDVSGLSLTPGGFRTYCCGAWELFGAYGYWWTSTRSDENNLWFRDVSYNTTVTRKIFGSKNHGFNVRCVKD